jgi:hypothetical protein
MPRAKVAPARAPKLAASRPPRNRQKERIRLADNIDLLGTQVDFPCQQCFDTSRLCIVMESRTRHCSTCIRYDSQCNRVFSGNEWDCLRKEETRVASLLVARDFELVLLQQQMHDLERDMARIQKALADKLGEHSQLRKYLQELKQHGNSMLRHDASVIELSDGDRDSTKLEVSQYFDSVPETHYLSLPSDISSPSFWETAGVFTIAPTTISYPNFMDDLSGSTQVLHGYIDSDIE